VAVLFDLASEVNRNGDAKLAGQLKALGGVLGLLERTAEAYLQAGPTVVTTKPAVAIAAGVQAGVVVDLNRETIDAMIAARTAAKRAKNFAEADRIRDELRAAGVVLEDGPGGTTWRRA
jgi:cysteinyl-tRNA synthetase